MAYPIKYIENNLVFNHDGECFAYYELLPYNYSFLSPEQKYPSNRAANISRNCSQRQKQRAVT